MLETLLVCPMQGVTHLPTDFQKDVAWFQRFLPRTDGVFIIYADTKVPIPLCVDACMSGCGAVTNTEAYHLEFPSHILQQGLSISQLDALNGIVVIKVWAPKFANQLVHLFSNNAMPVASYFPSRKMRDPFLQACDREIWLTCCGTRVRCLSNLNCRCPESLALGSGVQIQG